MISSVRSFIHSVHFYSASSSPLLLRSAPDTARILCRSFTPKRHDSYYVLQHATNLILSVRSFIHSGHFYSASSNPLLYLEAPPTQHGYCAAVSRQSATIQLMATRTTRYSNLV